MNRINIKIVSSLTMLSLIVLQVLTPTVYSASELFAGLDTKLATINDFEEQSGTLVLDLNASEEVSVTFDYQLLSDALTYDVSLNDNDLDVSSDAVLEQGINELAITEENQNYSEIASFDIISTRGDASLVEIADDLSETETSEVASETETSEVASETEVSEVTSETEVSEAASETEVSEVTSETEVSEVASELTAEKTANSEKANMPTNWQDPSDSFVYEDDLFTKYEEMYGEKADFDFGESYNNGIEPDVTEGTYHQWVNQDLTQIEVRFNDLFRVDGSTSLYYMMGDFNPGVYFRITSYTETEGFVGDRYLSLTADGALTLTASGYDEINWEISFDNNSYGYTDDNEYVNIYKNYNITSFVKDVDSNQYTSINNIPESSVKLTNDTVLDFDNTSDNNGLYFGNYPDSTLPTDDSASYIYQAYDNVISGSIGKPKDSSMSDMEFEYDIKLSEPVTIKENGVNDAGDQDIVPGDTISYDVELTNNTALDLTDFKLYNKLVDVSDQSSRNYLHVLNNIDDVDYVTWNDTITAEPSTVSYSGSLSNNTFAIDSFDAGDTIKIMYDVTANDSILGHSNLGSILWYGNEIESTFTNYVLACGVPYENSDEASDYDRVAKYSDCNGSYLDVAELEETKYGTDEDVKDGDILPYTITLSNPTDQTFTNVPVRDSMVEDHYDYITYNDDFTMSIPDSEYSGDLGDGTLSINSIAPGEEVSITYSTTITGEIPRGTEWIENDAWQLDQDPQILNYCDSYSVAYGLCAWDSVHVMPDIIVDPTFVSDEDGDGYIESGEVISYNIEVTNTTDEVQNDISIYAYFGSYYSDQLVSDIVIDDSDLSYSGDLFEKYDFVIDELAPNQVINISFDMVHTNETDHINDYSSSFSISAYAYDAITETQIDYDSSSWSVEKPNFTIDRSVVGKPEGATAGIGDTIEYTISVKNDKEDADLHDLLIENSMFTNGIPAYLDYNEDAELTLASKLKGVKTSGDFLTEDFTIDYLPENVEAQVTYSFTIKSLPKSKLQIVNVVTVGNPPQDQSLTTCTNSTGEYHYDCAQAILLPERETEIRKTIEIVDDPSREIIEDGDQLKFEIDVKNPTEYDAQPIFIKDSLLEKITTGEIDYLTWDGTYETDRPELTYSGDLGTGDFKIDLIGPGESVAITFLVNVGTLPDDVYMVDNTATDDGTEAEMCTDLTSAEDGFGYGKDCNAVMLPTEKAPATTLISKSVAEETVDSLAKPGETMTYTIDVKNISQTEAVEDVVIRDSMLETLPDYLTYNDDLELSSDIATTGDLKDGDYTLSSIPAGETVTLTYSITLNEVTDDLYELDNVVTDNGENPIDGDTGLPKTCTIIDPDCSRAYLAVEHIAKTEINKTVVESEEDGIIVPGEELTYTLEITNLDSRATAYNIAVRDSLLENLPEYLILNDEILFTDGLDMTGDITNGDLVILEIPADTTITITYILRAGQLPEDLTEISNIATIDGTDPSTCDTESQSCSEITVEVDPKLPTVDPENGKVTVDKAVTESIEDGYVTAGETLTYDITLTNENSVFSAKNTPVHDSMLEDMTNYGSYEFLTLNEDFTVTDGIDYTGSLLNGDFVVTEIPAAGTATITYSVRVGENPDYIDNVATVTGEYSSYCWAEDEEEGLCSEVTLYSSSTGPITDPTQAQTQITKTLTESDEDGIATPGETLTYKLLVTNSSSSSAKDVVVRDSMLESLPSYITFNDDVTAVEKGFISSSEAETTGSLTDGDFTIVEVPAAKTVEITYSVRIGELPTGVTEITNIATNDGTSPIDPDTNLPIVCEEESTDCSNVVITVDPSTPIDPMKARTTLVKSLTEETEDGIATNGEKLTYQLALTNNSDSEVAHNVVVRDSMLESLPSYITFNDDVAVTDEIETTGSLTDGDFTVVEVPAASTVTITYSVVVNEVPSDVTEIVNIATNDGTSPIDPDTNLPIVCEKDSTDCSNVEITVDPTDPTDPTDPGSEVDSTDSETADEANSDAKDDNYLAMTGSKLIEIIIGLFALLVVAIYLKRELINN